MVPSASIHSFKGRTSSGTPQSRCRGCGAVVVIVIKVVLRAFFDRQTVVVVPVLIDTHIKSVVIPAHFVEDYRQR